MKGKLLAQMALVASLLAGLPAHAHKPSDSYVTLSVDGSKLVGRWDIALRDLNYALGLDSDGSGVIRWGGLKSRWSDIEGYALSRLSMQSGPTVCSIHTGGREVVRHSDGTYAVLRFSGECPTPIHSLEIDYQLFFDQDAQHRGLARIQAGGSTRALIFSVADRHQHLDVQLADRAAQFLAIVKEGVHHIWKGYDHLLFLLALLLPSVLKRGERGWKPLTRFRPAIKDVLKIVTAFTVAHSLTLSLAALGVVQLPSRVVESGIAASVLLAALNNVFPILRGDRWTAAFALGLLHGFGFSATLVDLGLPKGSLLRTLFGFNLGVELGQLAVVAALFPLAYFARETVAYRRLALLGGSLLTAVIACVWFLERSLQVSIFPA
jgi:hypothetical protein